MSTPTGHRIPWDCQMEPARFLYQKVKPDSTAIVSKECDGFECSVCGERFLRGRDAEAISREWFRAVAPVSTGGG